MTDTMTEERTLSQDGRMFGFLGEGWSLHSDYDPTLEDDLAIKLATVREGTTPAHFHEVMLLDRAYNTETGLETSGRYSILVNNPLEVGSIGTSPWSRILPKFQAFGSGSHISENERMMELLENGWRYSANYEHKTSGDLARALQVGQLGTHPMHYSEIMLLDRAYDVTNHETSGSRSILVNGNSFRLDSNDGSGASLWTPVSEEK